MSYIIFKSDGTVLTTIADGTINTTSTPLALPGRLYPGYGQVLDTNIVHLLENFADTNPPPNAIQGQLWYNITPGAEGLYVCPADGESDPSNWVSVVTISPGANAQFDNIDANNIALTNALTANLVDTNYLNVNVQANIANANVTGNAVVANLRTANITTGANTTAGNLTGAWTVDGTINSLGNVTTAGVKTDNYYYANGAPISFAGTYSNANVNAYLAVFNGNVGDVNGPTVFNGNVLTTGSNTKTGSLVGNWTLSPGSKINGLSDISAANITGQVANALVAGTVYTNAQPNITSVGTLTSLNTSGIASAVRFVSNVATGTQPLTVSSSTKVANLNADLLDGYDTAVTADPNTVAIRDVNGNLAGNYIIGNGAFLTGLNTAQISAISNGPSNVAIATSGGNVAIAVGGLSNLAVFSGAGLSVAGNISTSNISATRLTGILTTAAQPNVTSLGTLTSLNVSGNANVGNIGATNFVGGGASLTDLNASNLSTGTVPSGRLSGSYGISVTGSAATAGTVTTNAQPNITSVGTLTSATVTGNVTAGNVSGGNLVSANFLSGTLTTAAQPNVTSVGTLTGLTSTGNITAPYFIGEVVGNIVPGNIVIPGSNTQVLFNNQGSIGTDAKLTFNSSTGLLTVNGNVQATRFIGSGANLTSINGANVTGTVANATYATSAGSADSATTATSASTASFATSAGTAGTVTTAAQPNITSVGTLSALNVTGNISGGNISGSFVGNGSRLSAIAGANVTGTVANATYATSAGSASTAGSATTATSASTADSANTATTALRAGTVTTNAQPNITSLGTLTFLTVNGNFNAVNVIGTHYGSGAGLTNIPGANVSGAVSFATTANSVAGANVSGTVANATYATSAGSATTATTAGTVTASAQPNITSVGSTFSIGGSPALTLSDFTQNFSSPGWTKLPNGLIIQWGAAFCGQNQNTTITYPTSFSTLSIAVISGGVPSDFGQQDNGPFTIFCGTSSFTVTNGLGTNVTGYWIAVGF